VLADARQVKNLPGRPKRDTTDSQRRACCFEPGAIRPCFVAAPEFRLIRLHTRYRRDLTSDQTRDKNRVEKLLESAAVKISAVLSDVHGVTGRDFMDHLIAGERDPAVLAGLARKRARAKISQLEEALEGADFFTPQHVGLLRAMLERIDRADAEIARLSQVIEELLAPYEEQLAQAESMPGWGRRAAQDVLAETGTDMTASPPPAAWPPGPGRTPLDRESGTRRARPAGSTATGTSAPSPARPPSPPTEPIPVRAPGTGAWCASAARPRPAPPQATPRCACSTCCYPTLACGMPTSAPAGTTTSARPPAASAAWSAPWTPWATKSPSAANPNRRQPPRPDPPARTSPFSRRLHRRLLPRAQPRFIFRVSIDLYAPRGTFVYAKRPILI
jgi:transposase